MTDAALDGASCINCGAALNGPFCAQCGQRATSGPPTVRAFLHDAAEELLGFEGKLFRTLRALFLRPGFLTREAFDGRLARYIRPLRLYLICSAAAFALMALTSGARVPAGDDPSDEQFLELLPYFMFVMVPAFAFIVMLVMRKSGRTYPQHLYFALHVHAVMFALTAVTTPFELVESRTVRGMAALARAALTIAYGIAAMRTAYGCGWLQAMVRGTVVLIAYAAWMFLFIFVMSVLYLRWSGAT